MIKTPLTIALAKKDIEPVMITGYRPGGEHDEEDDFDDAQEQDNGVPGISEGDASEEALPLEEEDIDDADMEDIEGGRRR